MNATVRVHASMLPADTRFKIGGEICVVDTVRIRYPSEDPSEFVTYAVITFHRHEDDGITGTLEVPTWFIIDTI